MDSTVRSKTRELNWFTRLVWLLLNILFGGFITLIMIVWVSCDMEMPSFIFPFLPATLAQSVFHVPWLDMRLPFLYKILFNASLFALFGFVHTFFAQSSIHRYFETQLHLPKSTLRTVYLMLTNTAAWLLMGLWQHTSIQVWDILSHFSLENPYRPHLILVTLFALITIPSESVLRYKRSWFAIFSCFQGVSVPIQFGAFEFFGLKQIFQSTQCPMTSRTVGMNQLATNGVFRYCRNPMYLFLLLGYIVSPCLSLDKLLFTTYTVVYLCIAIPIEERKLEKIFGQAYIDYKCSVPCIIPNLYHKKKV
jgi:methanethiol S-methyltransferase